MTRTTTATATLLNLGATPNNGQGTTLRDGGNIINQNFTDLYTTVNAIGDYTLPTATDTTLGGIKIGSGLSIDVNGVVSAGAVISPATVVPLADGVAAVGTSLLYAREDHVHPAAAIASPIPTGIIVMWSGTTTSVPSGWALCDGTNGTPNLFNKFIVGAGGTYTVNATGGSANSIVVSHTHSLGAATFAGNPLAAHTHTVTGHTHAVGSTTAVSNYAGNGDNAIHPPGSGTGNTGSNSALGLSSVSAGTPAGTIGGATDTTGASGTNANLPPYFALAYIMKP